MEVVLYLCKSTIVPQEKKTMVLQNCQIENEQHADILMIPILRVVWIHLFNANSSNSSKCSSICDGIHEFALEDFFHDFFG